MIFVAHLMFIRIGIAAERQPANMAGRQAAAQAVARGHQVTAVVRDPAEYADLRVLVGNRALQSDSDTAPTFSYADLATALIDEAVESHHHRTVIAVG